MTLPADAALTSLRRWAARETNALLPEGPQRPVGTPRLTREAPDGRGRG